MEVLEALEIKAFVPAQDYQLSQAFYCELGFVMVSDEVGIAAFRCGDQSFLLQDFYEEKHASNFMMHLLVKDVESWHQHLSSSKIVEKYQVKVTEPEDQPL